MEILREGYKPAAPFENYGDMAQEHFRQGFKAAQQSAKNHQWHKWPGEKPPRKGYYLIYRTCHSPQNLGGTGVCIETSHWSPQTPDADGHQWPEWDCAEQLVTHWMELPPGPEAT